MENNRVEICGEVTQKALDYALFTCRRTSMKEDEIHLWNLPNDALVGDHVSVVGKLECRDVFGKKILGVSVDEVNCWNGRHEVVCTGTIIGKGEIRRTHDGKYHLDTRIRLANGTFIHCMFWRGFAHKVFEQFKLGDKISVNGLLFTRSYPKNSFGVRNNENMAYQKVVTELHARGFKKVAV